MSTQKEVLAKYGRAIVHMRQQIAVNRFGLVLGAGASIDLGFPLWKTLVERIAEHDDVQGKDLVNNSGNTSISQLLFQRFRQKLIEKITSKPYDLNRIEADVLAGWQTIVHSALYRDVPSDVAKLLKRDEYLKNFIPVIKTTPLTINYNFDDSVQRMLLHTRSEDEKKEKRGFTTVWNANIQMFPRMGVIYHPNGFLPYSIRERPSEHLVFLEDSFADQLINSMAGHYSALSYHLTQATRLLIGLSLDDSTLKHLLRQNAVLHPGHYHYYIAFVKDSTAVDKTIKECTVNANFDVYNLVTLYLNAAEIGSLGTLLSMEKDDFRALAEEVGVETSVRFLITGAVAAGKTTTVSQFRSLSTLDEWLEERPPGMEKDPSLATPDELDKIDRFVVEQVALKNLRLLQASDGIFIVDRAPLDLFAFEGDRSKWKSKAKRILEAVAPGKATSRRLAECHVIFLCGDPEVLAVRAKANHRNTDSKKLTVQQDLLKGVYDRNDMRTSVIDTRNKTPSKVAKEIARILHLSKFEETPLHQWLEEYANEP